MNWGCHNETTPITIKGLITQNNLFSVIYQFYRLDKAFKCMQSFFSQACSASIKKNIIKKFSSIIEWIKNDYYNE